MGEAVPREVERAAHALALDAATAELAAAFEARGIAYVLLKGPAIAHRLYADDLAEREYGDVDVLVEPSLFTATEGVLEQLGFDHAHGDYRVDSQSWMYESEWERVGPPPVYVDLHRGFHGVGDWNAFWTVMDSHASRIELAGRDVRIPDAAGCALVVALHDSSTGRSERSATDLRRALAAFDDDVWRQAAQRAEAADALPSLVLGLGFHEAGRVLVQRLGLPTELPADVATRSLVASGVDADQANRAWALQHRLSTAPGWRGRVRELREIAFPPAEFLKDSRSLARRGRVGLLVARVVYPFDLALRAPRIIWLVFRGRHRARRSGGN